jgi:SAM-dependent methyltransferase
MPKFVVDFGSIGTAPAPDGRLEGPAFRRNHAAIWTVLDKFLRDETGDVLEIGSGTGQHITEFARRAPRLNWWPSDIIPVHLASIDAWRRDADLANLRVPQRIDLSDPEWSWQRDGAEKLTAMIAINVLHISPWRVSQNLMAGAGRLIRNGGWLFVYGPFMRGGAHTAPGNATFDASLRTENPEWGVRDVADLNAVAEQTGLTPAHVVEMPANNLVLAFERALRHN